MQPLPLEVRELLLIRLRDDFVGVLRTGEMRVLVTLVRTPLTAVVVVIAVHTGKVVGSERVFLEKRIIFLFILAAW